MAKASRTKRPPEKVRVRASVKQDKPSGWKFLLQVLVIGAACIWIYHPVLHGDWLWDDDKLVTNNSLVHDPNGWWKIWLEPGKLLDYQPLGISVVWLEWHAWGSDTLGYHWVNVFFHFLSALLVWRLLAKVGLRFAWLGGLLFAVHPIMVETVAWISEFKNTLSLPLFLLSLICWIDYEERRRRNDYFWALGLFLAAMLIKPSMVMFPVVILLIAWWKRGRIGWSDLKASAPFFAVSLVLGLVTIWFANRLGLADFNIPLAGPLQRTALAGLSFSFYFSKFFLPVGLLPIYCRWPMTSPTAWAFLPWPVLGGVICFFWSKRRGWGRHALLGLGFFLLMLAPFVGFTNGSYMTFTWVMDHLVYIPVIGLIGLTVAGLESLAGELPRPARIFGAGFVAAILMMLVVESRGYARLFLNQETLWIYTLKYNPEASPAHNNLGIALGKSGRIQEAIAEYHEALRTDPGNAEAHNNLAVALRKSGRIAEALDEFALIARSSPDFAEARTNFGNALIQTRQFSEAVDQFNQSLRINPDQPETHYDLGIALGELGRLAESVDQFRQALRLKPGYFEAHNNLGVALFRSGHPAEAIDQFKETLRLNPNYIAAHNNLGTALSKTGRPEEARAEFEQSLRIEPGNAVALEGLKTLPAREQGTPPRH